MNSPFGDDWARFERALTTTLERLVEGEMLVISVQDGYGYVQFQAQGLDGARIEAASNNYIDDPEAQLAPEDEALMLQLGWNAPTGTDPDEAGEGSPNFYVDPLHPLQFAELSLLLVQTLHGVFRVDHPDRLQYQAFQDDHETTHPELGIALEEPSASFGESADLPQGAGIEDNLIEDPRPGVGDGRGCPVCCVRRAERETVSNELAGLAIQRVPLDRSRYLHASYDNARLARCSACGTYWLEQYWELVTPAREYEEWGERYWAETPLSDDDLTALTEAEKSRQPLPHNHFWARPTSLVSTNAPLLSS